MKLLPHLRRRPILFLSFLLLILMACDEESSLIDGCIAIWTPRAPARNPASQRLGKVRTENPFRPRIHLSTFPAISLELGAYEGFPVTATVFCQ